MQSNNYTVDTGTPRHVFGHAVSGAVSVGVVSGIANRARCKKEEINRQEALRSTLKDALIGGVATATAVSVANNLGSPQKSLFQTLGSLVLGAGAIYTIEKSASLQETKMLENKANNA